MTTITIFVLWLLIAIVLNYATRPQTAPPPPGIAPGPAEPVEPEGTPADGNASGTPDDGGAASGAAEPGSQNSEAGEANPPDEGEAPPASEGSDAREGEPSGQPDGTGGGTPGV